MPKLIRAAGDVFEDVEDAFVTIEDDAPDPGGDIIVSLARFLAGGESLAARSSGRLGVRLASRAACFARRSPPRHLPAPSPPP